MLTMEDQLIFNWLCELQFSRYQIRGRFRWCIESDRRDADIMLIQMGLSTRLKPWANYIRWCDLNPDDDWRAQ